MTRTFYANGITGQVFIYSGYYQPVRYSTVQPHHLDELHFHSDLAYLGLKSVIDVSITHSQASAVIVTEGPSWYEPWSGTDITHIPTTEYRSYDLGVNPEGPDAPFIAVYSGSQIPAGTVVQSVGRSFRSVSIGFAAGNVKLYETTYTQGDSLPSTQRNYRVYIFKTLFSKTGNISVRAEPQRFIAGFGKLDTNYKYVRATNTSPDFYVTANPSIDLSYGGGWHISYPDGTESSSSNYSGSGAYINSNYTRGVTT